MTATHLDTAELAAQLSEDGVAFTSTAPVNAELERNLQQALGESDTAAGYVVSGLEGGGAPHLRDIAQELLDNTDLETVVVRSPGGASAVSDVHTRAEIEAHSGALSANPDYVAGVRSFISQVDGASVPWVLLAAILLIVIAAVSAAAFWSARKSSPHP